MTKAPTTPARPRYEVIIIGGAIMGAAVAWFLAADDAFDGRVLVVERDPSLRDSATARTTSCIRQQFSTELNVRISQFAARYIADLRRNLGDDDRVSDLAIRNFGYLYLAGSAAAADVLRANHAVQRAAGAATRLLSPAEIAAAYPFYALDDIVLGSLNTVDEGYFDGMALCDAWRRGARDRGVEWVTNAAVGMTRRAGRIESVTLASGETVNCGQVVNAAGARAAAVARMAGIALPVEARKRYSWVFRAERPLDRDLPLTIDPSGVHVRENGGGTYQAGAHGADDPEVDSDDLAMDPDLWIDHVWPALAARIPQFEAIRVTSEWAGHYDWNTFDQNAILGPHPDVENLHFLNGFSGHGLQQAPAMGRGLAERLVHGRYRTLDLAPFDIARIVEGRPFAERAII